MADAAPLTIPEVAPYTEGADIYPAAMAYANAGLYIAPTARHGQSPGKNPGVLLGGSWPARTVTGGADAYALFAEEHGATACGIALHCGRSGLIVLDIDTEDATIVPAPLLRAIQEAQPPYQTTRAGAVLKGHYLFRQPPGRTIGNSPAGLGTAWGDVRGKNGVVILAGSWHAAPDGLYQWQRTGPIPVLPEYVADLLTDGSVIEGAFSDSEVQTFLDTYISKLKPHAIEGPVRTFADRVRDGKGRHSTMIDMACWAMREAMAGLYPAREAQFRLAQALSEAVGAERDAGKEIRGILAWSIAQVALEPGGQERRDGMRAAATAGARVIVNEDGGEELDPHPNVLPSPSDPAAVARALAETMPASHGVPHTKWWRDEFYLWTGTRWSVMAASVLEGWLYERTEDAEYVVPADGDDDEAEDEYRRWKPTIKKVEEVTNALAKLVLQHHGEAEPVLACANGVVDLGTLELHPPSPATFNLHSLPFDFDPDAQCPRWELFLKECMPDDQQGHDFLAEWFGYVLSGRTDQQKIASLIGKRRGGKGTIARVLTAMVGRNATTAPDITDLGSHFGRASLIGKSLAVMADVRWNSNLSGEALKTFLAISGEDVVTIPRKHKEDWTGRSGLRFMVLSNDVPTFADRSNAIGSRMIHLKFDVTFEGREDFGLEQALMREMAGILNWSLRGLARLNEQGRFTVPESGQVISAQMEENANPVGSFIEDMCELEDGAEVDAVALLEQFNRWAARRYMKPMELRTFLTAARHVTGVGSTRVKRSGLRYQMVTGLRCTAADVWIHAEQPRVHRS
jgi:putative DNA primase/helicase